MVLYHSHKQCHVINLLNQIVAEEIRSSRAVTAYFIHTKLKLEFQDLISYDLSIKTSNMSTSNEPNF